MKFLEIASFLFVVVGVVSAVDGSDRKLQEASPDLKAMAIKVCTGVDQYWNCLYAIEKSGDVQECLPFGCKLGRRNLRA